jgi:hypothetical protein
MGVCANINVVCAYMHAPVCVCVCALRHSALAWGRAGVTCARENEALGDSSCACVCSVWVWAAGLTAMPQLGLDAGRLPTVSETLGRRESQAESRSPSPARHEGGPREDSHGDDGKWCFACLRARTGWVFTLLFVLALRCVTPCAVAFAMPALYARVVYVRDNPQRPRRHLPPCCSRVEAQTAAGTRRHCLKKFPHFTVCFSTPDTTAVGPRYCNRSLH